MKFFDRTLIYLAATVVIITIISSVAFVEVDAVIQPTEETEANETMETVVETVPEMVTEIVVATEEKVTEETIPEFVYEEQIPAVPLYFQQDYADVDYGNHGTVSSHGCGITSVAMVFSYLLDEVILPSRLAEEYGYKNHESGSCWTLFPDSGEDYGLKVIQTGNWKEAREALERGQVVIANARSNTIFTTGGHYIVLAGMTEDGRVIVRDPNRLNYGATSNSPLGQGFAYGFEQKYLRGCSQFWIYPHKDYASLSAKAEAAYYAKFH